LGPTSTEAAKRDAPQSLRGQFGTDATQNACHGSDSQEAAARELSFHFLHLSKRAKFWGLQLARLRVAAAR